MGMLESGRSLFKIAKIMNSKKWITPTSVITLTALTLTGVYIGISESHISFEDILLLIFCFLAVVGFLQAALQFMVFLKAPPLPPNLWFLNSSEWNETFYDPYNPESGWGYGDFGDSCNDTSDGGCDTGE
jgi:hypothetical protein